MSTTGPDHERWEDTAGTYVLGALPAGERIAYEAHLAACTDCRAEVEELRIAAEALPVSAPAMRPPPALKARIMAEVEREAVLLASASGRDADRAPAPPRRRSWRERFALPSLASAAALACVALVIGLGAGALVFGGGASARTIQFQRTGTTATAELDLSDGDAMVVAHNLPAPAGGKVYQVWLQRPGKAPEPTSALFTPRSDGSATAAVVGDLKGVQRVLVNTEPPGGSSTPTSDPVLTATLT
jgi:anti-sigma-K factor RskA